MPNNRIVHLGCLVVIVAATLSACGSDGPDADSAPDTTEAATDGAGPTATPTDTTPADASTEAAASGETVEVKALDNTFIEDTVEVAAGTEVVWRNGGRNDHDIVPVLESDSWGVAVEGFAPGDSYSHVFSEPGEYRYYCTIHGTADVGMTGTIIVE